jgi:hypothetical protein
MDEEIRHDDFFGPAKKSKKISSKTGNKNKREAAPKAAVKKRTAVSEESESDGEFDGPDGKWLH